MPKVLRFFKSSSEQIKDWKEEQNYPYFSDNRSLIDDTIKASKFHDITSMAVQFQTLLMLVSCFSI